MRAIDIQEEQKCHRDANGMQYLVIDGEIFVEITSSNDPFSSSKNDSEEINIQGASISSPEDHSNESLQRLDQEDAK